MVCKRSVYRRISVQLKKQKKIFNQVVFFELLKVNKAKSKKLLYSMVCINVFFVVRYFNQLSKHYKQCFRNKTNGSV